MSFSKRAQNKSFHIESLERREMMAGDVTVAIQSGTLFVKEAANQIGQANNVAIYRLANGVTRIEGLTGADGVKSKVNGAAYVDYNLTSAANLNVALGAGNDLLRIGFDNGTGRAVFNTVTIDTAAPDPSIAVAKTTTAKTTTTAKLTGVDTTIFNPPDADKIMIFSLQTGGAMTVNTGAGNDWIFMGDVNLVATPSATNRIVTLRTGAGADNVTFKRGVVHGQLDIITYNAIAENDADVVYFDQAARVDANLYIYMGAGADIVDVTDPGNTFPLWNGLTVGGMFSIGTDAGNDTLYLRNFNAGMFAMDAGTGDDNLLITTNDANFGGNISGYAAIYLGFSDSIADNDVINIDHFYVMGNLWIFTGGGNDVVNLTDVTSYHNFSIKTGFGNDSVKLIRILAVDSFMADLGDGNDNILLDTNWGNGTPYSIDGGAGFDSITIRNRSNPISHIHFEELNGRLILGDLAQSATMTMAK